MVSRRTFESKIQTSRLVRLVQEKTKARQRRCRLPRRPEIHVELRQDRRRVVLPPLLRFSARPQHFESRGPGRNPQDHGLLDSARRLRLSNGRRSFRHRDEGGRRYKTHRAIRHAPHLRRISILAPGRRHRPRRSQRRPQNRHAIFRRVRRTLADDVQLRRQSAFVLRARFRRQPSAHRKR